MKGWFYSDTVLWPDASFPVRIRFAPVSPLLDAAVKPDELYPQLPKKLTHFRMAGVIPLTEGEYAIISEAILERVGRAGEL